jgi:hypothetical protein
MEYCPSRRQLVSWTWKEPPAPSIDAHAPRGVPPCLLGKQAKDDGISERTPPPAIPAAVQLHVFHPHLYKDAKPHGITQTVS